MGKECVNKQSQDLACKKVRFLPTQLPCLWPINMIKLLWFRLEQCLGTFTILLVEASSERRLFRHLSDYVFSVRNSENTKSMSVIFVSKCLKFNIDFKNSQTDSEKISGFLDNCIWIGIVNLSLLSTGYFSSAPNVLTSSRKILHVNKRDFFQLKCLDSDQSKSSRCCNANFSSAWALLPCCLPKGLLKWVFLNIYLTTFS